jgi:hypothetical protein
MLFGMVSKCVLIRIALGTLRAEKAANTIVERIQMSLQCRPGGIRLRAVWEHAARFRHISK